MVGVDSEARTPMKNRLAGPMITLVALLMSVPSYAFIVSTSVGDYDVTTVTGGNNTLLPQLKSEVWWGNEDLAIEFAFAVKANLGTPNRGGVKRPRVRVRGRIGDGDLGGGMGR